MSDKERALADDEVESTRHAVGPSGEQTEKATYCRPTPRLTWNGDPDAPGAGCASCGFVVAEDDGVAYGEKPFGDRQKTLFE